MTKSVATILIFCVLIAFPALVCAGVGPGAAASQPSLPPASTAVAASVKVTFADGKLSISAENSTLNDILQAVQKETGAAIDAPPLQDGARVVVNLGPGEPADILAALFNGTRFNYLVLGSAAHDGGIERIVLTRKSAAPVMHAPPQPVMAAALQPEGAAPSAAAPALDAVQSESAKSDDGAAKEDEEQADRPKKKLRDLMAEQNDGAPPELSDEQKAAFEQQLRLQQEAARSVQVAPAMNAPARSQGFSPELWQVFKGYAAKMQASANGGSSGTAGAPQAAPVNPVAAAGGIAPTPTVPQVPNTPPPGTPVIWDQSFGRR